MRGDPNRTRRVAELLKRELAEIVQQELHDPRVQGVTLTTVDVSPDLSLARVYFTALAGVGRGKAIAGALNHAAGFMRHELMGRLTLRTLPQLRFFYDESVEREVEILNLIDQAAAEDRERGKA